MDVEYTTRAYQLGSRRDKAGVSNINNVLL